VDRIPGQRLEHYLNEWSGRQYEVVSIGGGGWGQRDQLAALRDRGVKAKPDVVVTLFLSLNDVSDNYPSLKQRMRERRGDYERRRIGQTMIPADRMPLFWVRGSKLNQLVSHRLSYLLRDRAAEGIPQSYFVYARNEDELWKGAWVATAKLFTKTKEVVESIDARYAVVTASTPHGIWGPKEGLERLMTVYPGMRELEWDLDKPDHRVARICRELGVPLLALEPLFREETAKGRQLHYKYDGHWNAEGNDQAAQYMARFLLDLETQWLSAEPD
jgi:hypothetical protein